MTILMNTNALVAERANPNSHALKSSGKPSIGVGGGTNFGIGFSKSTHGFDGQVCADFWPYSVSTSLLTLKRSISKILQRSACTCSHEPKLKSIHVCKRNAAVTLQVSSLAYIIYPIYLSQFHPHLFLEHCRVILHLCTHTKTNPL